MPIPPIYIFQPRGQCIILLLAALRELRGSVSKQTALQYISDRKWFCIEPEDLKPYPSQQHTHEPRWKTLVAWGRKDSVIRDYIMSHERDSWALSREGIRVWDLHRPKFASGEHDVRRGYLWTPQFKRYLCPTYEPSASDAKRPWRLYDDIIDVQRLFGNL
jgi:hypothetical protein